MGNPYIDYALNALREMDRYWKEVIEFTYESRKHRYL